MRFRQAAVAVAGMSMLAASGCATQAGAGEDEIAIGVVLNQTGAQGAFDAPVLQGLQLAVEQINSTGIQVGDTKYKLKLVTRDAKSDPSAVSTIVSELVQERKVKVVFGPAASGAVNAMPITKANKVLYMSSSSELEEKLGPKYPLVFRPSISARYRDPILIKSFLKLAPKTKKVAFLEGDTTNGRTIVDSYSKTFGDNNVTTTGKLFFDPEAQQLTPQLTKIAEGRPDLLFGTYLTPANTNLLRGNIQLRAAPNTAFLTFPLKQLGRVVPKGYPGKVLIGETGPQLTQPTSERVAKFKKDLVAKLGKLPDSAESTMYYYDAAHMLAKSMATAGSTTDTAAIAKSLRGLSYDGVYGTQAYDENGRIKYPVDVCTYADRKLECKSYS